jgi:hypothetical protein
MRCAVFIEWKGGMGSKPRKEKGDFLDWAGRTKEKPSALCPLYEMPMGLGKPGKTWALPPALPALPAFPVRFKRPE